MLKPMEGRFWVFAFNGYYPSGGLNDLKFSADLLGELDGGLSMVNSDYDYYQIVDTKTKESLSHYSVSKIMKWAEDILTSEMGDIEWF